MPPRQPTARKGSQGSPQRRQAVWAGGMVSVATPHEFEALVITVPMPPSTNRLYATVNGRRVKTREAREYADGVRDRVWLWVQLRGNAAVPPPPYRLTIVLHPATRRRIDVSNSIKCLEDGLFMGLEGNDRAVVEVIARLGECDPLYPRAVATLEHLAPSDREES